MKRKLEQKSNKQTLNKKQRAFLKIKGSRFVFANISKLNINLITLKQKNTEKNILNHAERKVAGQKSGKKKLFSFIFFALNLIIVALVLTNQLNQDGVGSLKDLFEVKINFWFLFVNVLLFALMMILKTFRLNLVLKHSTKKSLPATCYKLSSIGRYYDCMTPMASGGQPFQIYYLSKRGIKTSSAISVPLTKYFLGQFAWLTICFIAVVTTLIKGLLGGSDFVLAFSIICFLINVILVSTVIFISTSKRAGKALVGKILKFLQKIKIIKNFDKQYERIMSLVEDYQYTMRSFVKNKPKFILLYFVSLLILLITHSFTFFIYSALVGFDFSLFFDFFVMSVMIEIATSMIPLPGGTGMSELSFTAVFASFFTNGTMFFALLFSRFMCYYVYLLQGICVLIYDYFIGNRKHEWNRKKWSLQAESLEFRKNIENSLRKKKSIIKKV